jgi:hypothetical protein
MPSSDQGEYWQPLLNTDWDSADWPETVSLGCSHCGCLTRHSPADIISQTLALPPPYTRETDAELRRAKPRKMQSGEQLLATWTSLLYHLQQDESRWVARGEAWIVKKTTKEAERKNPRFKPYLYAIEGRLRGRMQHHIETAIVHREMCRRHQRSRCFCWSFSHNDEVLYFNFKALFEERKLEFFWLA